MSRTYTVLSLSRIVLRVAIVANLLFGVFVLALLITSLVAEAWFMDALGLRSADANPMRIHGMRLIMVVGILSVPLAHRILTRLLAIVETVGRGDPFMAENAARLQAIAWALLGLELLHLAVGAAAAFVSTEADPLDINWTFSATGWLAVLLTFVLARVFDHGARMREELEGTV